MDIICPKCVSVNDYHIIEKSTNKMAYCNQCQSYIKNIPYDKPKLYVGKYKGIPIDEIEDFRYLKWALENLKNSVSIRIALIDRIEFLELSKDPTNNG